MNRVFISYSVRDTTSELNCVFISYSVTDTTSELNRVFSSYSVRDTTSELNCVFISYSVRYTTSELNGVFSSYSVRDTTSELNCVFISYSVRDTTSELNCVEMEINRLSAEVTSSTYKINLFIRSLNIHLILKFNIEPLKKNVESWRWYLKTQILSHLLVMILYLFWPMHGGCDIAKRKTPIWAYNIYLGYIELPKEFRFNIWFELSTENQGYLTNVLNVFSEKIFRILKYFESGSILQKSMLGIPLVT